MSMKNPEVEQERPNQDKPNAAGCCGPEMDRMFGDAGERPKGEPSMKCGCSEFSPEAMSRMMTAFCKSGPTEDESSPEATEESSGRGCC